MTEVPAIQNPADQSATVRQNRIAALLLAVVTIVLYLPVRGFEFNNYDDAQYLTKNPWVQYGLRRETIAWAFTTGYAGNWHPLTWLSHMLDWQVYGANAGGHHLTSLLFHVANTLLLFGLLQRITGSLWQSAFVAAVFAWHPLRAESVAWVAERKDVLCASFGLLSLWAWAGYRSAAQSSVSTRARFCYCLSLVFFVMGLMSKPMLVSLPILLLLLDFWPFRRVAFPAFGGPGAAPNWKRIAGLLLEKSPYFALTLAFCFITYRVQKAGGAMTMTHLGFGDRAANAINSYAAYLGKIFWPRNLAVPYVYPQHLPAAQIACAGLFLLAVTICGCWLARSRPYLITGWLWYLIMLVPVIGLVQVGDQPMADRYTYLPSIGIAIMVAWGIPDLLAGLRSRKLALGAATVLVLTGCLAASNRQIGYWRNSITLFQHSIAVDDANAVAHCNLGEALALNGDAAGALVQFDKAISLVPEYPQALNNKALLLDARGQRDEAIALLQQVLEKHPDWPDARRNLAKVMLDRGLALAGQGNMDGAIAQYREALAIAPNAFAENALGGALQIQGRTGEALQHYLAAIQIKPDFAEAHLNIGRIYAGETNWPAAAEHFDDALKLNPDLAGAHAGLANVLELQGRDQAAIDEFRIALRLQPADPLNMRKLAWILATDADARLRDGAEALRLTDLADQHAPPATASDWDIRSAACAAAGNFADAVAAAQKAVTVATEAHQDNLASRIQQRLQLYQAGTAFHQSANGSTP